MWLAHVSFLENSALATFLSIMLRHSDRVHAVRDREEPGLQ